MNKKNVLEVIVDHKTRSVILTINGRMLFNSYFSDQIEQLIDLNEILEIENNG